MTIARAREILGRDAEDLTDPQVEALLQDVGDLVDFLLEVPLPVAGLGSGA